MNIKKILAGVLAGALAVSAIAVNAMAESETPSEAEPIATWTLAESGMPDPNNWMYDGNSDLSKVTKVVANFTYTTDYFNGQIGANDVNDKWTESGQLEPGKQWTFECEKGLKNGLKVEIWWMNAGTLNLDSVVLYDADGNVVETVANAAPAETDPAATTSSGSEAPAPVETDPAATTDPEVTTGAAATTGAEVTTADKGTATTTAANGTTAAAVTTAANGTTAAKTTGAAGNVNGTDSGNKGTGLAIAIVPAALAAAGVVISKKRK